MNGTTEPSEKKNKKSTSKLTAMSIGIDKEKGKEKSIVIQYAGEPIYDYIQQQIRDGMVATEAYLREDGKVQDKQGNITEVFPPQAYKNVESKQEKRCKLQNKPIPKKVKLTENKAIPLKPQGEQEK